MKPEAPMQYQSFGLMQETGKFSGAINLGDKMLIALKLWFSQN